MKIRKFIFKNVNSTNDVAIRIIKNSYTDIYDDKEGSVFTEPSLIIELEILYEE